MDEKINVFLKRCDDYALEPLQDFLRHCLDSYCSNLQGMRVLIKPNLISSQRGGLAATDIRLVLALVDFLQDRGATVALGDSPAFGSCRWVLRRIGVERELEARNVRISEFENIREMKLASGRKIGIASDIFDCDLLINVPKVKAHCQMYATLGVKNIFGVVKGMRKSLLHMLLGDGEGDFAGMILDLLDVIPANVTLADGIIAMHKNGPVYGEPLSLGCLAFSENAVAIDSALLSALELEPSRSPIWREAQRRGMKAVGLENLHFPLEKPSFFHGSGFEPPQDLVPIRFSPTHFIWGNIKRAGLKITGR